MADVLIVGAGVAGASLAIGLGRGGCTVELFDAADFPREKPCGEGLMPAGVLALQRLGLAEAVGGMPFHGVRYHAGSRVSAGRFPLVGGQEVLGIGQRRYVLDQVLVQSAAATPGVRVRTGIKVDAPLVEGGRVAGVIVDGQPCRAPLVVAADGAHSRFRHRLGLDVPVRRKRIGARVHFRLADGGQSPPWVDVFLGRGFEFYVTPLPRGEALVALLAEAAAIEGPVAQAFHAWRLTFPELRRRLDGAQPITPLMSTPLGVTARAGAAPGVVLLGDAAGFIDPITGGGMAQALTTAELLVRHILERQGPADAWLHAFDRDRRAMLRDYERLTRAVLALARHPALARAALSGLGLAPSLFSHLVGVSGGVRSLLARPRHVRSHAAP